MFKGKQYEANSREITGSVQQNYVGQSHCDETRRSDVLCVCLQKASCWETDDITGRT